MYPERQIWLHYERGIPRVGERVGCHAASLAAKITQSMLDIKHGTSKGGKNIGQLIRCSPTPVVFSAKLPDYKESFVYCENHGDDLLFHIRGEISDLIRGVLRTRIRAQPLEDVSIVAEEPNKMRVKMDNLSEYHQRALLVRATQMHGSPLGSPQRPHRDKKSIYFLHRVGREKYMVMLFKPPQLLDLNPNYVPVAYDPKAQTPWEPLLDTCNNIDVEGPLRFIEKREGIYSCESKLREQLLLCFSMDPNMWNHYKPHVYLMARLMCVSGRLVPLTKLAQLS